MAIYEELETKRLKLIPFSEEYLTEKYVGWLNDREVVKYSEQRHRSHNIDSCREYLASFRGTSNYFWAIISKDEALEHIGSITAYVDNNNLVADLGIMIGDKKVWGKGYGTEAWTAVCDYLFMKTKIRKITAGTMALNAGMRSIMRRAGMVPDGARLKQCIYEKTEIDMIYAALFKDVWQNKRDLKNE